MPRPLPLTRGTLIHDAEHLIRQSRYHDARLLLQNCEGVSTIEADELYSLATDRVWGCREEIVADA